MMPERTSDRDSCSQTHASRAKTFEGLDAWRDFDADVLTFLETLDDTEAKFNPLVGEPALPSAMSRCAWRLLGPWPA
jgi:hypothetical protein